VNLFWVGSPAKELDLIRSLLRPDGALFLFYEPPGAAKASLVAEGLMKTLPELGFADAALTRETEGPSPLFVVVARPR
jgi:hypothetical protein